MKLIMRQSGATKASTVSASRIMVARSYTGSKCNSALRATVQMAVQDL
ncbi:MAG: hypothetical protein HRU31_04050 [Rhodobacteraceae bacterium]|nr:hypothetical protein [Paracoccaceae bacterium]